MANAGYHRNERGPDLVGLRSTTVDKSSSKDAFSQWREVGEGPRQRGGPGLRVQSQQRSGIA